jgi:hypothetical protein
MTDVVARLQRPDFEADPRICVPIRLVGPAGKLDLIGRPEVAETPRVDDDLGSIVAWLHRRLGERVTPEGLRVAHPAAITVMKALAWRDRHADRDAIDLARLALWDDARGGEIAGLLATVSADLPSWVRGALRHAADAFHHQDAPAVCRFVRFLGYELPALREDETLEEEIRAHVARSVRALLHPIAG